MRATAILVSIFIILGAFLWVNLSGASLFLGGTILVVLAIIAIGYTDTAVLFFLGSREVKSGDEAKYFRVAAQEAYKLAVPQPHLYFYNGSLERGFVLQHGKTISLVLSRSIIDNAQPSELSAICFELLLQVKKGLAKKRTRVMFLLGSISWVIRAMVKLISKIIPIKEVRQAAFWGVNYLLYPFLELLFKLTMGRNYFKKLQAYLAEFPQENELIEKLALKHRKPVELHSLPSRKLLELLSSSRSGNFQNIMVLELLPHEWDILLNSRELGSAQ